MRRRVGDIEIADRREKFREHDARAKLCPAAALQGHCRASGCMVWAWADPVPEIEIFKSGETDADFVKRRDLIMSGRKGYCGL